MTRRGGYVVALVAAVLVLVGSVIAVVAFTTTSGPLALRGSSQSSSSGQSGGSDGWRQGLAGGGMMGSGPAAGSDQYRGMMGRSGGGMMGDWNDNGTAAITAAQAKVAADGWVTANQPGAVAGQGVAMPMGYLFTVSRDGQQIGRVIVNDDTGAVSWVPFAVAPAPSAS